MSQLIAVDREETGVRMFSSHGHSLTVPESILQDDHKQGPVIERLSRARTTFARSHNRFPSVLALSQAQAEAMAQEVSVKSVVSRLANQEDSTIHGIPKTILGMKVVIDE